MTAKQAIKLRCRDCLAGDRDCTFTDCVLKGLAKGKGKVKKQIINAYCRWCLNGHPFTVCASTDCAIYHFRKEREVRKIAWICGKTGGTDGCARPFPVKAISTHGKTKTRGKSGVFAGTWV
jgi:hypothetical protein